MQYVRSISGSVSKTWNSINPATLSGAIDVIVVEQEDGSLACSPFHVRFGKFSLLRPFEKKVEFSVNNVKQNYAMKLGEGGEAFFVFETSDNIPEDLQTSPLVSPASSPPLQAEHSTASALQEPEFLDLSTENGKLIPSKSLRPGPTVLYSSSAPRGSNITGAFTPLSTSPDFRNRRPESGDWSGILLERQNTDELHHTKPHSDGNLQIRERQARSLTPSASPNQMPFMPSTERSISPPPLPTKEAIERAMALSKQLSASNIPSQVTDTGDLMLDMTGYKSSDDDALRAEVIARKILSEELEGNYDIGALIGADEHGNLWIYSSEEAKEAATQRAVMAGIQPGMPPSPILTSDAASDPGYHSEGESEIATTPTIPSHRRSDSYQGGLTPPQTPPDAAAASGDPNRNYAKTLRLTSDQLKALGLKPGPNTMSFTVNRATCQAYMYLWRYDVPVVVSDIDGTITKSDALGHVLNMIGRDWTHIGVAKLYTEIVANGYNIMYLTSRSVGQADTTRAYLNGVVQEGYRLPRGPTIMSPDRTIAALRREIYLRKPEVFKMACLRDIKNLFGPGRPAFYAGFGNRLTDALSYRSVSIPSNRIFTINSNAEVSLDLLSLNKLKLSYVNMREVVDHYFPPVSMLVEGGGEEFTDFTYWRDDPLDLKEFSDSDNDDDGEDGEREREDNASDEGGEEDEYDEEGVGEMGDSYISRNSIDENDESNLSESALDEDEENDPLANSMFAGDNDRQEQPSSSGLKNADGGRQSLPNPNGKSIPLKENFVDTEAEIISGMLGISLVEGPSEPIVGSLDNVPLRYLDFLGGPSGRLKSSASLIKYRRLHGEFYHHVDLMDFHSNLDNNGDAQFLEAQLHTTLQEDLSRAMRSCPPLLTHLNADTSWLLSIPVPQALPEPDVKTSKRERVPDTKKQSSEEELGEGKNYFHILIDPWLRGSQSDVARFFSQQWHAYESAVQTIEEVEKRIWEIEERASSPVKSPSTAGSAESESRTRSAIDAVLVSHEFSDHMHKETLLEIPSSVPVFAASKAAGAIRSWRHFNIVNTLPALGSNNKNWRLTSLSPLPPWLGISRLGVDRVDLLYYHSAVMVAFSSHADADSIPEGDEGEASSTQAVIYTPHGIAPSDLAVVATASPPIHTLALLHGLHDINLRAAQLNLGAHNGLKVQRMTRAKYWIGTHDEVKRGRGVVSWFLKRKVLSVKEALEKELQERGEKSDEGVLDDVKFVELGNGESLLLE